MRIDELCTREPVHIPLSCTLQEAAVQMRDQHVGSLIVTEATASGTRVAGVLTDRDIVLGSTAAGTDPCTNQVGDIMTRGLVTVGRHNGVADAMQLLLSHGVRRLGVLDGEALIGVISMDDIVGAMAAEWGMLSTIISNEQERERTGHTQSALHV
uniref:CBS n=2 Tax=Cupriavidus TaxID=106589 RepID=Q473A8_CUPPJ